MDLPNHIRNSFKRKDYRAVWKEFSDVYGGRYLLGSYDQEDRVEINYRDHIIVFDHFKLYQVVGAQSHDTEFTRIRFEFKSPDNLRFRIIEQTLFDDIGKLFGLQDIRVGDKKFDFRFLISGTDEYKVQTIFSQEKIKNFILSQNDILLQALDGKGIYDEPVKEGYTMLYYISEIKIRTIVQLEALLTFYKLLIDEMIKLGSINEIARVK